MEKTKKIISVLCSVFGTVLVLAVCMLAVNTYVGSEAGYFFEQTSAFGVVCRILSLFLPFLLTILAFLTGLLFGKHGRVAEFIGADSVLSVVCILCPFISQFIFTDGANNAFSRFVLAGTTVLSMPAKSIGFAFNEAVNLFLTDFSGSRIFVFVAVLFIFLLPVIFTGGFLAGKVAKDKEPKKKEIDA